MSPYSILKILNLFIYFFFFFWHHLLPFCVVMWTWVFRNLSSVNERTRQRMRDMRGLVDSLVLYIQQEDTAEDKVRLLKPSPLTM